MRELLDASMKAGNVDASLRILVAMTAMSPLASRARELLPDPAAEIAVYCGKFT